MSEYRHGDPVWVNGGYALPKMPAQFVRRTNPPSLVIVKVRITDPDLRQEVGPTWEITVHESTLRPRVRA